MTTHYCLAPHLKLTVHADGSGEIDGQMLDSQEIFLLQHLDNDFPTVASRFAERFQLTLTKANFAACMEEFAANHWVIPRPPPTPRWLILLTAYRRPLYGLRKILWGLVPLVGYGFWQHRDRFWLEISELDLAMLLWLKLVVAVVTVNLGTQLLRAIIATQHQLPVEPLSWRRLWGVLPRLRFGIDMTLPPVAVQQAVIAAGLRAKLWLFCATGLVWLAWQPTGHELGHLALIVSQLALGAWAFTANPLWPGDGYRYLALRLNQPKLQPRAWYALSQLARGQHPHNMTADTLTYGLLSVIFLPLVVGAVLLHLFAELRDWGRCPVYRFSPHRFGFSTTSFCQAFGVADSRCFYGTKF